MAKILLAGPGTGKTTKIKELCAEKDASELLIVSFTNATIEDLQNDVEKLSPQNCKTLHSLAFQLYKHFSAAPQYVLSSEEITFLEKLADTDDKFLWLIKELNCITFDTMISEAIQLLKNNPEECQRFFAGKNLFMADEIQDFNTKEFELVTTIMSYIPETILLGDDDQCIYKFKGSTPEIAIAAYNDNEVIEHHHKCYRCPKTVVEAGTALLTHNTTRIQKEWHFIEDKAGNISFVNKSNLSDMWRYIKDTIAEIKIHTPDASFMVLYPYGAFVDGLEDVLSEVGIECLIDEKEKTAGIRLRHKIMAMWDQNSHKELSILLYFILSIYRSKKAKIIMTSLWNTIYQNAVSVNNLIVWGKENGIADIEKIESGVAKEKIIADSAGKITESFFDNNYYDDKPIFDKEKVNFLSIHKSKGLAADYVFIVGLQQHVLPRSGLSKAEHEEERRKLFVAITRGKKGVYLMASQCLPGHFTHKLFLQDIKHVWNADKTIKLPASQFISEMGLAAI
ncbi:MAG: ATP-dependent helicase [Alphaproteobacteria bacterium]|nr:ATP-dependent helicase [Alphaproteobacteria bacterium]